MVVSVQILGTGCAASTPSLLIQSTDGRSALVNVGDGLQRLCFEHKIRLTRVNRAFFTQLNTATTAGLGGMMLTLSDMGIEDMHFHGPPGAMALACSMRYYFYRPKLALNVHESSNQQQHHGSVPNDESTSNCVLPPGKFPSVDDTVDCGEFNMTPIRIRVLNKCSSALRPPKVHRSDSNQSASDSPQHNADALPSPEVIQKFSSMLKELNHLPALSAAQATATTSQESHSTTATTNMCYLVHVPTGRGTFLPGVAKKLGVSPGPDFGKLSRGESITTADGRVVTPEECAEPPVPAPLALIISCPTVAAFDVIRSNSAIQYILQRDELRCIVHITPQSIVSQTDYSSFFTNQIVNKSASQIMLNDTVCSGHQVFLSSARMQLKLNQYDSAVFPIDQTVVESNQATTCTNNTNQATTCTNNTNQADALVPGVPLMQVSLQPARRKAKGIVVGLDKSYCQNIPPVTMSRTETVFDVVGVPEPLSDTSKFQVTFLGTGSAIPSKFRNVTANLIALPSKTTQGHLDFILLDCGEGTVGQLERRFGVAGTNYVLSRLEFIWISHMHADHHLGTLHVLARCKAVRGAPVVVGGPQTMGLFLADFEALDNSIQGSFMFFDNKVACKREFEPAKGGTDQWHGSDEACSTTNASSSNDACCAVEAVTSDAGAELVGPSSSNKLESPQSEIFSTLLVRLGLSSIETVPVLHCYKAYGIVIDHEQGWRLVFSGDTEPCEALVEAGRNATMLIHEATLEDDKVVEAREKRHSTISEAVRVGRDMNAEITALTHFSQRYPKIARIAEHTTTTPGTRSSKVVVAFDLMSFWVDQVDRVLQVLPIVQEVFEKEMKLKEEEAARSVELHEKEMAERKLKRKSKAYQQQYEKQAKEKQANEKQAT